MFLQINNRCLCILFFVALFVISPFIYLFFIYFREQVVNPSWAPGKGGPGSAELLPAKTPPVHGNVICFLYQRTEFLFALNSIKILC